MRFEAIDLEQPKAILTPFSNIFRAVLQMTSGDGVPPLHTVMVPIQAGPIVGMYIWFTVSLYISKYTLQIWGFLWRKLLLSLLLQWWNVL